MSQEEPPARLITLPSNVSICSGPGGPALLRARVFTRLATTAPNAATLAAALAGGESVAAFCHQHDKAVLIFDEDDDNYDTHSEHFRAVCLRLKAHGDIGLELAACIFEAPSDLLAGFQLESMKGGDVCESIPSMMPRILACRKRGLRYRK
ncbi:hypothetical protein GGR56DRAFT_628771 [Xylariaceae sp. FL0804]|nr:hypothetical protein GGR56DRAFT_628771 [Xylariaceae sp. FL0804]